MAAAARPAVAGSGSEPLFLDLCGLPDPVAQVVELGPADVAPGDDLDLAMIGECTGKVRSTPTPKLTLRTVNVSRAPLPWRRITAPWKSWTRSRVPSTTRTWTFSVSPGAKSGMSSRRLGAVDEIGAVHREGLQVRRRERGDASGRPSSGGNSRQRGAPPRRSSGPATQIGAAGAGPAQRLGPPPAGDPGVVARPQHLGHVPVAELGRARVLRVLDEPRHRRSRRTTPRPTTPRCPSRPGTSRVTASITTSAARLAARRARSRRPRARRRSSGRRRAGRRPRSGRRAARTRRRPRARARAPGRSAARSPTARAAAAAGCTASTAANSGSGIITMPAPPPNGASSTAVVHVGRERARVVHAHVEQRRRRAPDRAATPQRPREVLGEDREHVDAHRRLTGRTGRRAGRPRRRRARATTTNTIGTSAPPSSTSRSCAGFASTDSTRPMRAPARSRTSEPISSCTNSSPSGAAASASASHRSCRAAPRPRCGRRRPSNCTTQPLPGRRAPTRRRARRSPTNSARTGREALGDVADRDDVHLAAQTVRPADASDLEEDGVVRHVARVGATPRPRP